MKSTTSRPNTIPPFQEFTLTLTRCEAIRLAVLCGSVSGQLGAVRTLTDSIYYAVKKEFTTEGISFVQNEFVKEVRKEVSRLSLDAFNQ